MDRLKIQTFERFVEQRKIEKYVKQIITLDEWKEVVLDFQTIVNFAYSSELSEPQKILYEGLMLIEERLRGHSYDVTAISPQGAVTLLDMIIAEMYEE